MKYLLACTTAILALSGAASAQEVTFDKGTVNIALYTDSTASALIQNSGMDAAFSVGNFGFQFGGNLQTISSQFGTSTTGAFDLRFYKPTANGNKFGAYVASTSLTGLFEGSVIGVEAMVSAGPFDVEVSVGTPTGFFFGNYTFATLDGYLDIGDRVTLNVGYDVVFDQFESIGGWTAGASYKFPGSGMALSAYAGSYEIGIATYGVGLSWDFGANSEERLWSDRSIQSVFTGA